MPAPATCATFPVAATMTRMSRLHPFPSAKYTLPATSTAMPIGYVVRADDAGPPLPVPGDAVSPAASPRMRVATVVAMLTRQMEAQFVSVTYMLE